MSSFYHQLANSSNRSLCHMHMQDEEAFFRDYAESHKKLSELGFTPPGSKTIVKDGTILAQSAFGVAVAAAVVIAGYLYEVRKKMK